MLRDRLVKTVVPATLVIALSLAGAAQARQFAYVADFEDNDGVAALSVAADGTLVPIAGSPFANPGDDDIEGIAITPDAKRLYAAGKGSPGNIYGYSIAADGSLASIPGATQEIGDSAHSVAITPNGRFVYVSNALDDSVSQFAIGADGSLTELSTSPLTVTNEPTGFAVSSDSRFLYLAHDVGLAGQVSGYAINGDGTLDELSGSTYAMGFGPFAVNLTPDGRFLYGAARGGVNSVYGFSVASDGELTPLPSTPLPAGNNPFGMTISPDGTSLFTANHTAGSVTAASIGSDGALTAEPTTTVDGNPAEVTTNAEGSRLFVSNSARTSIDVFALPGAGAPLAPITGSPFPGGVQGDYQSIALTPEQPPAASFTVKGNRTKTLNGTGTVDPDGGTVARYDWDFGDGKTLANGGAKPTHKYARGTYTATLTVTDDQGCSLTYVSAGETAFCNGSPVARTTRTIDAVPPKLKVAAKKRQTLGKSVKLKASCNEPCRVGARGTIKIAGEGKFKLRSDGVRTESAGDRERMKLRLASRVKKIANDAEAGIAKIKVVARDETGNKSQRKKLKIRLR